MMESRATTSILRHGVDIMLHSDCVAWQLGLEIPWNNEIVFAEKGSTLEFYKLYTVVLTVRVIPRERM